MALQYDVVVAGAGTAGTIAAIAAARTGAKTLLVEKSGRVGGVLQLGMSFKGLVDGNGNPALGGIGGELLDRLNDTQSVTSISADPLFGSITGHDPQYTTATLLDMCVESGVDLLFHTYIGATHTDGARVGHIVVANKAGLTEIHARQFVDCTGDADLVAFGGGSYSYGTGSGSQSQPVSAIFRVSNIDYESMFRYLEDNPGELDRPVGYAGESHTVAHLRQTGGTSILGFRGAIQKARAAGDFTIPHDILSFNTLPGSDEATVNVTRVQGVNGLDPADVTRAEIETQRQTIEVMHFLHHYIPGCEHARLASTPYQVGIRETRHIRGAYTLTEEDVVSGASFPDQIARGAYPLDIHDVGQGDGSAGPSTDEASRSVVLRPIRDSYGIPMRTLIPDGLDNVTVAGRPISATHEAAGSSRGQSVCMATGHAAGTYAALAALAGEHAAAVDISLVQETLRSQGAILELPDEDRPRAGQHLVDKTT